MDSDRLFKFSLVPQRFKLAVEYSYPPGPATTKDKLILILARLAVSENYGNDL